MPCRVQLHDHLTLIERRPVLTNERAEAELGMTHVRWLEDLACVAQEDLKALCGALGRADELTAERAGLISGTEQAKAKRDTLSALICKLKVSEAACNGVSRIVARAVRSLEDHSAAGEDMVNTVEARAGVTLEKMSEL